MFLAVTVRVRVAVTTRPRATMLCETEPRRIRATAAEVCIPAQNRELQSPAKRLEPCLDQLFQTSPLPQVWSQKEDWANTKPLRKNGHSMFQRFR